MIPISQLWNDIVAAGEYRYEYRAIINGVTYGIDKLVSIHTEQMVFDREPKVGVCASAEMTLSMLKPSETIPRMALIRLQVRVRNDSQTSEWINQGYYFIDTREETKNDDGVPVISFHCYDAMLKAEQLFPSTVSGWPKSDVSTVKLIAYYLGLQSSASATSGIDPRTLDLMTNGYQISAPAGYTLRETLSYIACMYAGNFIISSEGKLLLIAINGIPEETSLIVDESGNIITFGEDAISIVDTV